MQLPSSGSLEFGELSLLRSDMGCALQTGRLVWRQRRWRPRSQCWTCSARTWSMPGERQPAYGCWRSSAAPVRTLSALPCEKIQGSESEQSTLRWNANALRAHASAFILKHHHHHHHHSVWWLSTCWITWVFLFLVSTATLLGKNRGLDIIFKLISPHATKQTRTVKWVPRRMSGRHGNQRGGGGCTGSYQLPHSGNPWHNVEAAILFIKQRLTSSMGTLGAVFVQSPIDSSSNPFP